MTKYNIPSWVTDLKIGNELVIFFNSSGISVFAEVLENYPHNDFIQFGTITVKYTLNNVARVDDLLYDDYGDQQENVNSWVAYRLT